MPEKESFHRFSPDDRAHRLLQLERTASSDGFRATGEEQLLRPSSGWLAGRPPIAAPWRSVAAAPRRATAGTAGEGDSAQPLGMVAGHTDRAAWMDGRTDGWMKKGLKDECSWGLVSLCYWIRNGKITIKGKWMQLCNMSTTKTSPHKQ